MSNFIKHSMLALLVLCAACQFLSAHSDLHGEKKSNSVIDSMVSGLKNVKQRINSIFRNEPLRRQPVDILKDNAHVSEALIKKYAEKKSLKPEWNSNLSESVSNIMHMKISMSPYEKAAQLSVVDNQNFKIVDSETFGGLKKIK